MRLSAALMEWFRWDISVVDTREAKLSLPSLLLS